MKQLRRMFIISYVALAILVISFTGIATAKSLYVISNINASPTPIQSYDIQGNDLVYQTTNNIPHRGWGAVDITIDTDTSTLFVTYEQSNTIQLIDAETMSAIGTTFAPGASNLAGIVLDQGKRKVYSVDRWTNHLYIYDWNDWSKTLTLVAGAPFNLQGLNGAFGLALDEANHLLYVADYPGNAVRFYDTTDWILQGSASVSHAPIGVAIDIENQLLYTGSGWGGSYLLSQYNINTGIETTKNLYPAGVMGIDVDQSNGLVYLTTGYSSDNLRVFDSSLNQLWESSRIGDATGVCVPGNSDIVYNPLKNTLEVASGRTAAPDEIITYHIRFSNPTSSPVTGTELVDKVLPGTIFEDATGLYSYDTQNQIITWDFGTIFPGETYTVDLRVRVTAIPGEIINNKVTLSSDNYLSTTRESLIEVIAYPYSHEDITVGEIDELLPVFSSDFGTLWALQTIFSDDQPTFVISHGWNDSGTTALDPQEWETKMGKKIKEETGSNVYIWDWKEMAQTNRGWKYESDLIRDVIMGVPYEKVPTSGKNLAKALKDVIPPSYTGDIHLIGHSLGSGVITYAAEELGRESNLSQNIKQLTFLDSPWYLEYPAGDFLEWNTDIFLDNYWSALGRFGDIGFICEMDENNNLDCDFRMPLGGYRVADVNTMLDYIPGFGHSKAHQWYRSSTDYFNDPTILGDTTTPAHSEIDYGFYWWQTLNSGEPHYTHIPGDPKWKLYPGVWDFVEEKLIDARNWVVGTVVYAVDVTVDWKVEQKEKLEDFAIRTGKKVTILAVNTFNKAEDAAEFIANEANHAFWVFNDYVSDKTSGFLQLILNSEAIASSGFDIPETANAMRFSYEFVVTDPGGVLEVFIDGSPVFLTYSDDNVGKGWQDSDWIDVSSLSGQRVELTFRLSNPDDQMQGVVNLDDIIFAQIVPAIDSDEDGFVDGEDNCPVNDNLDQLDADEDGIGDACDNCPDTPNKDQTDSNGNGIGDICEYVPGDLNNDGIVDRLDIMIINSHRNQPTDVCPDCDIDGNGTITVLDARKLMMMCTYPRCANN